MERVDFDAPPLLVTVTVPPLLPVPPIEPKFSPTLKLSLPATSPLKARIDELLPPPPPRLWAKMP